MAGRQNERGFTQNLHHSQEGRRSPPGRSYNIYARGRIQYRRGERPIPALPRDEYPQQQQAGRRPLDDGANYNNNYDYPGEEEGTGGGGESNDNPLYEMDVDNRLPPPGGPSDNPLYGNDPFQPGPRQSVCMAEFLRPRGPHRSPTRSMQRGPGQFRSLADRRDDDDEDDAAGLLVRRRSPPERTYRPSLRRTGGLGLFTARGPNATQIHHNAPPATRFSPVLPPARPPGDDQSIMRKGKRIKQSSPQDSPPPPKKLLPQLGVQNIMDLIAAVRSDQNLLIAEVRRDGAREPRIPGDHDRYFAPRKGDIIIHFTPNVDLKLVEYFDERTTMIGLQPGDKLVRVKYDHYKIQDHLLITSKLYIYAPEWVYLGKAVQTIKTA